MSNTLAIHYGAHDTSACVYSDRIKYYFLEERFSRKKHDRGLLNVYKNLVISKEKIDRIVISNFGKKTISVDKNFQLLRAYLEYHNRLHGFKPKLIKDSRHHLFHAAGAYYNSGYKDALVVVIDGMGEYKKGKYEMETIYEVRDGKFKELYSNKGGIKSMVGIGILYAIAALHMGQSQYDAGKAMGLSAYGSAKKSYIIDDYHIDDTFLTLNGNNLSTSLYGFDAIDACALPKLADIDKSPENFCKEVQLDTQNIVSKLVDKYLKQTKINNVCMSGGYAMNIITNSLLVEKFPEVNFYFEPMATDGGISVGAAALYATNRTPLTNTFFHGWKYDLPKTEGRTVSTKEVARLIKEQKSIGIYHGYAEAGQRSLGNRSIVYTALDPHGKDVVNKIKKREWYRPFAASVLEEDADLFFDISKPSPFMTQCYTVKKNVNLPSVTHIDNTCRVQTVNSGHLYQLLLELRDLTGYGIILNTSLNLSGEPLVETPQEALNILTNTELDYLWFPESMQLIT